MGSLQQLGIVILIGATIVIATSPLLGSIKNSYEIFIDPPALLLMHNSVFELVISSLLMLSGLIILGFIISVITASMENTIRDIRIGKLDYVGSNHTIIINYNNLIFDILSEINKLHKDLDRIHEVVIITNNDKDIEVFQEKLREKAYTNLIVYIRFSDLFSMKRYKELSILDVHSIIILRDENIEDKFKRDNNNLKIANFLYSDKEFRDVLHERKEKDKPIKAVAVFSVKKHFKKIISHTTNSYFMAIAPKEILNNVLNISMINIDFYNIWSELLSFNGYELYFINPDEYNLIGTKYKDIVLKQEKGLLIGLSREINSIYNIELNALDTTVTNKDWLVFIASDENEISFKKSVIEYKACFQIEEPQKITKKDIVIIGNNRELNISDFIKKNTTDKIPIIPSPDIDELFEKNYLDSFFANYDIIIFNLEDELVYRVALNLSVLYSEEERQKFIFLLNDSLIASLMQDMGLNNTILSNILFSRYTAQVSNQITLNTIFEILFDTEDTNINLINLSHFPNELTKDLAKLKVELVHNNITYLGAIKTNGDILFDAKTLEECSKIIVLSNSKY